MDYDFQDFYDHINRDIEYLPESIICTELYPTVYEFSGCSCELNCSPDICSCLQRSGVRYIFEKQECLESYKIDETTSVKPIYECNDNCKCKGKLCGNKLVQCGPRHGLEIMEFDGKGLGLKTNRDIPSGSFICEYAERIITSNMARHLYPIYKSKYSMNYIFCIREQFGDKTYKTIIDPTESGNIGRYINHSCQPNCDLIVIRVQNNFPKLCIFAKEDINANEEISFNYGDSIIDNLKDSAARIKCLCGKIDCRKFLPYDEYCFE